MSTGRDPAKLLRWIIKETAVPNYANNPQSEPQDTNNDENKENIPITHLADLSVEERDKWRNIILGQTPDILNNRQSLQSAIKKLHEVKHTISKDDDNEEIKTCLYIIHNLLDKNEAVLAKLNGVPLLLELICNSMDVDNEICLDSCTILHDSSQNNPMMQNVIYSHDGIQIILETLQKCNKRNYKIRTKLWALIHVICREHNPNFNLFLANCGHDEINRILRIEQNNITDEVLKEILRVSRLINYMFTAWSDGNDIVFDRLNLLSSVNWAIYSLHAYVIRLVSTTNVPTQFTTNRLATAQLILDILMELVGGIRMFIKRNDKYKKFVIANKSNKDIVSKLKHLQKDLGAYCTAHRPQMKLEVTSANGKPYRFRYYVDKNDDDRYDNDENKAAEDEEHIYLAMKDIWNTIQSVLRHVKIYKDHCAQQKKLREIWRKTTKKGQQMSKKMRENRRKSSLSSASLHPQHQYQVVVYKKDKETINKKAHHKKKQRKKKNKKQ